MKDQEKVILAILQRMKSYKVDFVVIGGFAKYLHGIVDDFKDIDLFISQDYNTAGNIIDFLKSCNPNYKSRGYDFNDILRLRIGKIKIDFLPKLDGLKNEDVYENIVIKNYHAEQLKVLSLKDINTNIQTVNQFIFKT